MTVFDFDFDGGDFDGLSLDAFEGGTEEFAPSTEVGMWESAKEFARGIRVEPGLMTFGFVSGNFVFGDVLEAMCENGQVSVRNLTVHTLSLSQENIDSLAAVCDMCGTERVRMVASAYWYGHERGALAPYMLETLGAACGELDIVYAATHAKIMSLETWRGNTVTIWGSANLRSSANIEQLTVMSDRRLYDFVENVTEGIAADFHAVNRHGGRVRPLRRGDAWRAASKEV